MDIVIFFIAAALITCTLSAWLALLIGSRKTADLSFGRATLTGVLILVANQPLFAALRHLMPDKLGGFLASVFAAWFVFTIYHAMYQKPTHPGLESFKSQALAALPTTILYLVFQSGLIALIKLGVSQLPG